APARARPSRKVARRDESRRRFAEGGGSGCPDRYPTPAIRPALPAYVTTRQCDRYGYNARHWPRSFATHAAIGDGHCAHIRAARTDACATRGHAPWARIAQIIAAAALIRRSR